jgi:hypothetical protein
MSVNTSMVCDLPRESRLFTPDIALPAKAFLGREVRGMEHLDLRSLGVIPGIAGGSAGINSAGDIITETSDGVSLNDLWNAYQAMLSEFNAQRDPLMSFLSYQVTVSHEDLIGAGTQFNVEEASEYGEPVGVRPDVPPTSAMGYTFKWYDLGARFTWQFLADAPAQQVDSISNGAAEAFNRNKFTMMMRTVFNTNRRTNKEGQTVYPFYAGAVGDQPPAVGTTTFADQHNHFVTTNNASLTAPALEALQTLVEEHGYTPGNGYNLVLMINKAQEGTIRNFRSTANGGTGTYDFIPAQGTPQTLLPTTLNPDSATRPAGSYKGMDVIGSYSDMLIVKNDFMPAGYLFLFATGGQDNIQNPVAIRVHPQQSLRGLRLVKGKTPDYPLIDSFYNEGFGTGVRYRGSAAVLQIVASTTYAAPAAYPVL